jgi:indole-3-glycerol phosphate synthase
MAGNILDRIIETKRTEVAAAKAQRPLAELKSSIRDAGPARNFHGAIAKPPKRGVNLIAEIKKKSPSAGLIRPDFDPVALARTYHAGGADALSVLTDQTYFDGRLEYIAQVKAAVALPVLRKDFTIDEYQLYESRAAGADAVLLIGEVLGPARLADMLELAFDLGLTSLIEVHEAPTLGALQAVIGFPNRKRTLLGINNRNLKIQKTDLATTEALARQVSKDTILVSESGIQTRGDVERLIQAGARGLLIGETFMRSLDIVAKMTELLGPLPEE